MMPVWHAATSTPPNWTFTGITSSSPDYMQYRVWTRQTQVEGPIVSNAFTAEPNQPHLPTLFYWVVGKTATLSGTRPEFVYDYFGAVFAFLLTLLLFQTTRYFMGAGHRTWWVFGVIMLGGGLGGYFKWLLETHVVYDYNILNFLIVQTYRSWPYVFEVYRSHYVINTLFDAHFLLIWLSALGAILSYYFGLVQFKVTRTTAAGLLFAVATWLHVYEGVTLLAMAAGVTLLCWIRDVKRRESAVLLAVCTVTVALSTLVLGALYRRAGLPAPTWRAINILPSILLISYPVAFGLMAWGVARYWRRAGLDEIFLLGWALGCLVITLSGPFFPYPDRGTMTMLVPLYLIAGAIYFARFERVGRWSLLALVLMLGATPTFVIYSRWTSTTFRPDASHMYVGPAQIPLIDQLRHARRNDVLLADAKDLLWLAPEYPGRHYAGHFFLTVDYDRKIAKVEKFREAPDVEKAAFLAQEGIRYLFVNSADNPAAYRAVPGLRLMQQTTAGALFEFDKVAAPAAR